MSLLITFEGGYGSGKSTQAKMLLEYLHHQGYDVELLHEPSGTEYGSRVRNLLLEAPNIKKFQLDVRAQVLVFCSARAQLGVEKIIPRLRRENTITICDCYTESTIAYQVFGGGLQDFKDVLEYLLEFAAHGIKPDLTIYLDLSAEKGIERKERHMKDQQLSFLDKNHFDPIEINFHQLVRDGYEWLINREPQRWWRVPADRSVAEIEDDIRGKVLEYLIEKRIQPMVGKL